MASTYLSRTQTNGSRRKFTLSAWVKRSKISSGDQVICGFNTSPDYNIEIKFQSGDTFNFYNYNNASSTTTFVTNRKFRDTSGWYHMVVAVDTEQATEANRVKIYVNGVQETSFSTATYPSLDLDLEINTSGKTNSIGAFPTGYSFFDGSMSFINFIDGTQYAASDFGSTDSTTGQWQINTSPSVTYGTNGFFILKNGNSVTDQSGQSNNFTVTGGTLTDYKDCPDNVFATMNPLANYIGQWALFENNNTYVRSAGTGESPIASTLGIPATSGKFYTEVSYTSGGSESQIGLTPYSYPIDGTTQLGNPLYGYSYQQNGQSKNNNSASSYGDSYAPGDLIGIAVDATNSKLYFSKNGVWQNSGDPTSGATGTGAISISATPNTEGFYYIACCKEGGTTKNYYKWNFGNGYFGTTAVTSAGTAGSTPGVFEYDVPSGYEPLSTKGLNA